MHIFIVLDHMAMPWTDSFGTWWDAGSLLLIMSLVRLDVAKLMEEVSRNILQTITFLYYGL